jgi:hypothetical protein
VKPLNTSSTSSVAKRGRGRLALQEAEDLFDHTDRVALVADDAGPIDIRVARFRLPELGRQIFT